MKTDVGNKLPESLYRLPCFRHHRAGFNVRDDHHRAFPAIGILGHALVDIGYGSVRIVGGDALGGRLDDSAVALFALAKGTVNPFAVGDPAL
jgi:hypothetical protein